MRALATTPTLGVPLGERPGSMATFPFGRHASCKGQPLGGGVGAGAGNDGVLVALDGVDEEEAVAVVGHRQAAPRRHQRLAALVGRAAAWGPEVMV